MSTEGPPSLRIEVNGETRHLQAGATVADVVALLRRPPSGLAIARNGELVPRSSWAVTPLVADDRVEIVTVVAGG